MATILRTWSYQYPWLYNTISWGAALVVGGESRMRGLALAGISLPNQAKILDLCCGSGQATQMLLTLSPHVTGADASPLSLKRARLQVPQATYVETLAENMPFTDGQFDLVHTSLAMHEMSAGQRQQIFQEVYRVLRQGGKFVFLDFHRPTQPLFWPGLALFLILFETETSWQFIASDVLQELQEIGFTLNRQQLYAGGSLQTISVEKI